MANDPVQPDPDHVLHTIVDEAGRKLAERVFNHYVRDSVSVGRLPAFLIALDRLVTGLGGVPPVPDADSDPDADADVDDSYADDEDLHEDLAHETARVRDAVTQAIR